MEKLNNINVINNNKKILINKIKKKTILYILLRMYKGFHINEKCCNNFWKILCIY